MGRSLVVVGEQPEPPPQPQPLPPPPLPQPPDPPFPQPTATDGDGSIGGGGHCRRMALLLLPLLPLLFVAGLLMAAGRHRAADQPAERPDQHPNRLGAHEHSAFRGDQIPAAQLTRRSTPKEKP